MSRTCVPNSIVRVTSVVWLPDVCMHRTAQLFSALLPCQDLLHVARKMPQFARPTVNYHYVELPGDLMDQDRWTDCPDYA